MQYPSTDKLPHKQKEPHPYRATAELPYSGFELTVNVLASVLHTILIWVGILPSGGFYNTIHVQYSPQQPTKVQCQEESLASLWFLFKEFPYKSGLETGNTKVDKWCLIMSNSKEM
ncbi:hypothetical protein NE237_025184 [Protea cynaroides]|uniref:Uncharacterized protein n=1 Tax=Protea cynaroides TaxID=273540 RepID=A0A9Q0H4E3_9MAGN|nr:hypothetical protein NE237_025184 [Protea cynaroides]